MYQTETIIALGSNLGNAVFNLRCAVRELENIGNIKKFANIYISSPYGYKSQSNFFNTAIKLLTNQQPLQLINNIYEIEKKLKKNKKLSMAQETLIWILFFSANKYLIKKI